MIQVEVQIWNKRWWKVFNRQNSPEASSCCTEYQKLEYAEHGVSKLVCEHVGREAPKPRDHLEHKVRDIRGTRITKERKEVIQRKKYARHNSTYDRKLKRHNNYVKHVLYQTLFTARFLWQINFICGALSEINCYLRPKSSFLPWCRHRKFSNWRTFEKFDRAEETIKQLNIKAYSLLQISG